MEPSAVIKDLATDHRACPLFGPENSSRPVSERAKRAKATLGVAEASEASKATIIMLSHEFSHVPSLPHHTHVSERAKRV